MDDRFGVEFGTAVMGKGPGDRIGVQVFPLLRRPHRSQRGHENDPWRGPPATGRSLQNICGSPCVDFETFGRGSGFGQGGEVVNHIR